ncbi:MAG: AIM24 family protein [Trueperaceae bacterium]|nr:AIM24 family protein [Trueperaceae bacterium]
MSDQSFVPDDDSYTLNEFLDKNAEDPRENDLFELENPYTLEVNLPSGGRVKAKSGSMVAYVGNLKFKREGILEGGIRKALAKQFSGEGQSIMNVSGQGRLYLADKGKRVQVIRLQGEEIVVNGNDLLAMEDGMDYDVTMMRRMSGLLSGGLFNIRITGSGFIAITTHYTPLVLSVEPGEPIFTDPNATVAWSGGLEPTVKTDVNLGTFFGRSSGETIQLQFQGRGWVLIQPYEEVYFQAG